jgi:hypothetical protein
MEHFELILKDTTHLFANIASLPEKLFDCNNP